MKKDYIAPQLFEVIVHTSNIMTAASGQITTSGDSANVTPSQEEYSGNDWASRRSVWDDEDDEDF